MDNNKNLITLFSIFNNRPNHLIQFLLENGALKVNFLKHVRNSSKLSQVDINDSEYMNFKTFDEMNDYYNDLIKSDMDKGTLEKESNYKLFNLIEEEKYEEAAKLRDYMIKNKIKFKL